MITILMTYLNRPESLQWTLKSFLQYNHKDFEVVIIDDNSNKNEKTINDDAACCGKCSCDC